jgi:hypothetical protein
MFFYGTPRIRGTKKSADLILPTLARWQASKLYRSRGKYSVDHEQSSSKPELITLGQISGPWTVCALAWPDIALGTPIGRSVG